jgi:hypothetical protein
MLEANRQLKQEELEGQFEDLAVLIGSGGDASSPRHDVTPRGSRHLRSMEQSAAT